MKRINIVGNLLLTLLLAGALFVTKHQDPDPSAAPRFKLTDLGTLGGEDSFGHALNRNGDVAGGSSLADGQFHACVWSGGTVKDLGTIAGKFSRAEGINDKGDVTGVSSTSDGRQHTRAFLYTRGRMVDLGTLGGTSSIGWDIDNTGRAVGASGIGDDVLSEAFISIGGKMRPLGTGPGSGARAINEQGMVIGRRSRGSSDEANAFIWKDGKTTDLKSLPGGTYSVAYAVNEAGTVVGWSNNSNKNWRAVMWKDGAIADLGTLGGTSAADGVNTAGQVVGASFVGLRGDLHAFLYEKGKMIDLNRLVKRGSGYSLILASGINDKGQIVCDAERNHHRRAVLLTPSYEKD